MKNKVVIITGASSGIGKALAFAFGQEGAKIVITGRKKEPLFEVSDELTKQGIDSLPIVSDVSVEADNIDVVKKTIEKYGKIDILINNAGISMRSMFEDCEIEVIKKVMEDVAPTERLSGVPIVAEAKKGKNWGEMTKISV